MDIKWVSDNGIRSTNLGFINPRLQLEVYKKEHLNVPGTSEIAAEIPKEIQVAAIKKQLVGHLGTYYAEWIAERNSDPLSIDEGKRILRRFGELLLEFRPRLQALADGSSVSKFDGLLEMTKTIQKHEVYADGGISYREFWKEGDKILEQAKHAIEYIQ